MRAGEALGLDIRSIYEDFRALEIVQKAKRGELRDHMKTKNADSRHGRVVDLSEPLAAMLRDFVGRRTGGLVFCKPDGSQLMQRDILKHSLHPILKKLGLEQGWVQHLPALPHYRTRDGGSSSGFATPPGRGTRSRTCPRCTKNS
jgi:hypothetical protein